MSDTGYVYTCSMCGDKVKAVSASEIRRWAIQSELEDRPVIQKLFVSLIEKSISRMREKLKTKSS